MVTQDTSQWLDKKRGSVKRFLGNNIAELNLEVPAGAEKVTLYDQTDGSVLVVSSHSVDMYLNKPYSVLEMKNGTLVKHEDLSRRLFGTSPPEIESSVGSAAETVSKISGKKRKRGKRGRR